MASAISKKGLTGCRKFKAISDGLAAFSKPVPYRIAARTALKTPYIQNNSFCSRETQGGSLRGIFQEPLRRLFYRTQTSNVRYSFTEVLPIGPPLSTSTPRWDIAALAAAAKHFGRCYYELSKARLSFLVVTTATAGFLMGSNDVIDWKGLGWISVGTMMAAASANSFNQIMEMKNDSLMKRTMRRPLPSGRISRWHAILWAAGTGLSGITLLACQTNETTAALGLANLALYTLVYTPMKQLHPVNTWIGAVVGAIPPLMGWAAATGGRLDPGAYVLAGALYLWQLPHFMALAWMCKQDYVSGGYKMISLIDPTGRRSAAVAVRNCLYLLPLGFLAVQTGITTEAFAFENLLLTAGIGAASLSFYLSPSLDTARRTFRASLLHLPLLMGAMLVHRVPHRSPEPLTVDSRLASPVIASDEKELLFDRLKARYADEPRQTRELISDEVNLNEGKWALKQRPALSQAMPPVAFMSVAPFPFLPLPDYGARGY